MAGENRTQDHPVIAALLARSDSSAFFEVVRLLQALHSRPDAVRVGHQGPPSREAVRFRPPLDFSFGVNEVDGCAPDVEHERVDVACRFLGLYGTASPLPACYTEQLLYDDPDGRLRAFLDIFNHRLISFAYRTWEKYRHSVVYDGAGDDAASRRVRLLCHLERPGEPMSLLGFAGLLHQQPLSETSLEQILNARLRVPIEVRSCHVRWIDVPEHQRSALGNRNCTLGGLAPLGRQVRSATTTFGVHVGP
ncbi:MAG TPA: type VI secretion system baseplate subunit TssG, partial [Planctomycetota bacterium]|nr:type VI secretion system baseplate subunit TssG [Planctomycetota bacterium]